MRRRGRRRKTGLLVALGGLVIGVIVGVLVWFQPQKLFIDHRVDEVLPATRAPPATAKGSGQAGLASTQPAPRSRHPGCGGLPLTRPRHLGPGGGAGPGRWKEVPAPGQPSHE
jgi:hypothetical protein